MSTAKSIKALQSPTTVVLYDRDCGLCDHTIRFLLARDVAKELNFSPLQGDFAKNKLPRHLSEDLKTYVVWADGKILTKGEAVKFLIRKLKSLRKFRWILPIPLFLVNVGYDLIGRYRYKIFGKPDFCVHAEPEQRRRFLK